MSKGAKPGQNRFAGSQQRNRDYRVSRIKSEVIPKLMSFAGKISFDGITPFSKFCADLYNDGIPVNEKRIGYRTLVQSNEYWGLISPVFHMHWDSSGTTSAVKEELIRKLEAQKSRDLKVQVEKLKSENKALRSALRNYGAPLAPLSGHQHSDQAYMVKFDKTCRVLKLVLDASDGMFTVDLDSTKISCAFNDLEPTQGLAPRELVAPFVLWLKGGEQNHGDQ